VIDYLALAAAVAIVASILFAAWRRAAGPARSRGRRIARIAIVFVVAFLVSGYGAYRFSKARRVQLFGGIVPRVETPERVVALTFDDGPMPLYTDSVLALLEREGVRATFFLTGQALADHPAEGRKIAAAGHEVGNHSWSHRWMMGMPLGTIRREIHDTDAAIRRTGYAGPIHFRSPYGKKLVALPWVLHQEDRLNIFFDVEPESFPDIDADAGRIAAHVLERARPGSIILLHPMFRGRERTRAALPAIIDSLQARGYRFVTVSDLLALGPAGR
jgi:peptidoglycan-N-acetylglucosamine deacetylase